MMGGFDGEALPSEVWALIIKRSKTSQLLQIRQTCQRLFDLVEDSENFKAYLDEEDKVLHSLVDNWLGSPFDDIKPLQDDDWERISPTLRARFRTLAKPHIDQVTSWAENGQDTVLTSNKGWLYRIFVRKLHENQRRKIISPLRQRFEDVLQNRTYICKKCGGAFIPSQEKLCFSHVAEEPVKSTAYLENVWYYQCCPDRLFFARSGQPISDVKRALGECPKNDKKETCISEEFKNLTSMTASIGIERGAVLSQYSRELALEGPARLSGLGNSALVPAFAYHQPIQQHVNGALLTNYHPQNACAFYDSAYLQLPYRQNYGVQMHANEQTNMLAYSAPHFQAAVPHALQANFQQLNLNGDHPRTNNSSSRFPNPKNKWRFGQADWEDFFDNDCGECDFSDEEVSRKKRSRARRQKESKGKQKSANFGIRSRADRVPEPRGEDLLPRPIDNPPGEFEIGFWQPPSNSRNTY